MVIILVIKMINVTIIVTKGEKQSLEQLLQSILKLNENTKSFQNVSKQHKINNSQIMYDHDSHIH